MITIRQCNVYRLAMDERTFIVTRVYGNANITTRWFKRSAKTEAMYNKIRHSEFKNILHKLKVNGCAICGYNDYDSCLNFHHVNSKDKKFIVSASNCGRSNNFLAKELDKCILLCSNCHQEIHAIKRGEKRNE